MDATSPFSFARMVSITKRSVTNVISVLNSISIYIIMVYGVLSVFKYTLWDVQGNQYLKCLYGLTAFFCLATVSATVASANTTPQINLSAIAQIESSGRPDAVGDGGRALGKFQLHAPVIEDFNKYALPTHAKKLSHRDALNAKSARLIANWYISQRIPKMLRAKGLPVTRDSVLTAWNMGIGAVCRGKVARSYIARYERLAQ